MINRKKPGVSLVPKILDGNRRPDAYINKGFCFFKQDLEKLPFVKKPVLCEICGKKTNVRIIPTCRNSHDYCTECHKDWMRVIKPFLPLNRSISSGEILQSLEKAKNNRQKLNFAFKGSTCDILKQHHELLKDDPERLTTSSIKSKMLKNIDCPDIQE